MVKTSYDSECTHTAAHDRGLPMNRYPIGGRTVEREPSHPQYDGTEESHGLVMSVNRDELAVLHTVKARAQDE